MPHLKANGLDLYYELDADASKPCVVLIMGLGMQHIAWPSPFVDQLREAGFRVLRFDNRDIGLSEEVRSERVNVALQSVMHLLGFTVKSPYKLADMAEDTVALLDGLQIKRAHFIGVSMGGMIAQTLAARFPERVQSLTSIMSSSGGRGLPRASFKVQRALTSRPSNPKDPQSIARHGAALFRLIGSPDFPTRESELHERILYAVGRSYRPQGSARQLLAIVASGDRSEELKRVKAPTLILHGQNDPLVPMAHGEHCASLVSGARFESLKGMGHDLPLPVQEWITAKFVPFAKAHA